MLSRAHRWYHMTVGQRELENLVSRLSSEDEQNGAGWTGTLHKEKPAHVGRGGQMGGFRF